MARFTTLVVAATPDLFAPVDAFLRVEGHIVLRAESASGALAKVRQYQPSLILLNRDLPHVTCLEMLTELLVVQVSAAVVVFSAQAHLDEAVSAVRAGAMDYLVGPLSLQKLRQAIQIIRSLD